ncbi:MAG: tRNA preQ1(34) S-adenosylmethionine ribosyltransferase-isomerase QueA [Bdellovibrionota bacterium]
MNDYQLSSYDYELPPELIAERPVPDRHSSRLLVYDEATDTVTHTTFRDLPRFLPDQSTIIFNRSKVFPCRLLGKKITGGEAEVFLLTLTPVNNTYEALIRTTGKKKVGDTFHFGELSARIEVINGQGTFQVSFNVSPEKLPEILEKVAKIPIPPYIRNGESDDEDKKTYQTVYARETGSVAAPTAGLHFSPELLSELEKKHALATVTLHVGIGTFAKVQVENILEHKMHEEFYTIDSDNLSKIGKAKFKVAVGTTTLRTLESFERSKNPAGATSIFLYPGIEVKSIDALITNFHLPKSTLLMLVSSLIGREKTLWLYRLAVEERYRFFSYGDGMLIIRKPR